MRKTPLAGQTIILALGGISLPVAGLYLSRFFRGSHRLAGTATTCVLWKARNINLVAAGVNSLNGIFFHNFSYFCNIGQTGARFQHRVITDLIFRPTSIRYPASSEIYENYSAKHQKKGAANAAPSLNFVEKDYSAAVSADTASATSPLSSLSGVPL